MKITPTNKDRLVPMSGSTSLGAVLAAGLLLCVVGGFHILLAFLGVNNNDDVFANATYSYDLSLSTWGWIHLVLGILAVTCGVGVLMGKAWAYIAAMVIAFLSAVSQFAFLPQAPIWSALVIAFDVLVMWALVVELNEPS
jgi:multisubunit Na+/H+ antiporter MnhG subunit